MSSLNLSSLLDEINNIDYIEKCCNNKKKEFNSLSYLLDDDINLSQSECIKLGKLMEEYYTHIIMKHTTFTNIKPKNKKGMKERDILFIDKEKKDVYYSEIKSNLNLDTEKSKATVNKCVYIVNELQEQYPSYDIKWCLLGSRYVNINEIPKTILRRYKDIKNNVYGSNEFLNLFGINFKFNNKDYRMLINRLAKTAFKKL